MHQLLLILPIAVPVLFWAGYHYHKDRYLPEPVGYLLLTFGLGMLAVGLSTVFYEGLGVLGLRFDAGELAVDSPLRLIAYTMLAIGPIEEVSKLTPFLLIVLRFKEFDEPLDGIIYASFIGLGYAAVENWQYLQYLTPTEAFARGFASPVIHILFASIWGHWIAQAHLTGRSVAKATIAALAVAAALHGLYDFIVILNPHNSLPIAALIIVAIWLWRLKLIRALQQKASQDR
ncbi:MAG: PrsW family intramembrane metalloprotease [Gammaproteobacteria bacterium]|nr:PrsW family intramembrane metalloprotease [Gammaproteobacteria bacterium]MDH3752053.1 PrsW family intramembrane metalloprotease [Gammaproteobacteria bacterium]MDH3806812.1 PrsW family intramembrane metalloprotease [Gammaproteobacteria bacterium]